jgi:hypothetical protein
MRVANRRGIWALLLGVVFALILTGSAGPQATAQAASGDGLKGYYYDNKDLTGLKLTRTDSQVNFVWGMGAPGGSIAPDTFSVRWTGQVEPATSGIYAFYAQANDGVRLWVNGKLIINKWANQTQVQQWSGSVALQSGKRYAIRLEYFENKGSASVRLLWRGPGVAKQIIPKSRLYSSSSLPPPSPPPPGPPPSPPPTGPTLTVNTSADQHQISPDIYGMNFADEQLARELRLPVRRWGGNATTRYNWQNDTSNHASDWYFENIPEGNSSTLPNGSGADKFVEQNIRTSTRTLLTVPLIGWTPKTNSPPYACGFSISKYGAQQDADPWQPDCGNGVRSGGTEVTGNDPHDTSEEITPTFVQDWMGHLIGQYGTAGSSGVKFYNLDNEPMLWNETDRDVHRSPTSYNELRDRTYQYAAAIKAVDPGAKTLGPTLYGWTAYFYSALDWEPGGSWWNNPQDQNAHGGTPFVEWYLQQMRTYEQQTGVRILDYLDLHNYPETSGVALAPAGDAATQERRLRSTRSLWDPTYVDESWIGEPVRLIPRMRDWVNKNYPGTKLAISEYNWGALDNINGALAQADILGIFGREGLDLATLWEPPKASEPGAFAFRMYRNYDGQGGAYGDSWVRSTSTDQGKLAIYGAQRNSDGALTLMVINKTKENLSSSLNLSGFSPGASAQVYRYSGASLAAIARQADQKVSASGFTATYPANSITLIVIPKNG